LRRVRQQRGLSRLAASAGFTQFTSFYDILREDRVRATPLNVDRLERIAAAINFPKDEIFLDGGR
jgi:hypothetical protein